jgi:hypothetical protein
MRKRHKIAVQWPAAQRELQNSIWRQEKWVGLEPWLCVTEWVRNPTMSSTEAVPVKVLKEQLLNFTDRQCLVELTVCRYCVQCIL